MTSRLEQNRWIATLTGSISDPKTAKRLSDALGLVHQHVLHGQDGAIADATKRAHVVFLARHALEGHEHFIEELRSIHRRSPHHRF